MPLRAWHDQLAAHFAALRRGRDARWPIFALEHGLGESDRETLARDVATDVASGLRQAENAWLAYVVYATEFGYGFDGSQFWPSFADKTPGWAGVGEQTRREWIRTVFSRFHHEFGGYRPTGAFANHFNIIAWPIAHAILPQDHQQALARVLYDLRHAYSAELLASSEFLGQRVAERSSAHGSRFRAFCNPPDLVGLVAQALLLDSQADGPSLLLPLAFRRVVNDAEAVLEARQWLQGAQATARRITGVLPHAPGGHKALPDDATIGGMDVVLEPRLQLRPMGGDAWSIYLTIPSFATFADRHPEVRDFLPRSRVTFPAAQRHELGIWLSQGDDRREVRLRRWPAADEALLQFDVPSPGVLSARLQTELRLRPGLIHLFERRADGTATEVVGRRVRAGGRYLVLAAMSDLPACPMLTPQFVKCDGLALASLDLSASLSDDERSALAQLGLAVGRRIDLWPVGLPPASWDGQGDLELLDSGVPAVALRADHDIQAFFIRHPASGWQLGPLHPFGTGGVAIAPLKDLAPGAHRLLLRAAVGVNEIETLGEFEVRIRRRRAWNAPAPTPQAVRRLASSTSLTMDALWEGRLDLAIDGEPGSPLVMQVRYFDADQHELPCAETVSDLTLPLPQSDLREALNGTSLGRPASVTLRTTQLFRTVRTCKLEFLTDAAHPLAVEISPPPAPVALVVRSLPDTHLVGLLRVPGAEWPQDVQVERYPYAFPDAPTDITADLANYFEETPPGCWLYVIRHGSRAQAVVVPPRENGLSLPFSDLGALELQDLRAVPTDLATRLSLLTLWSQADTRGDPTAQAAREFVVNCFERQLFGALCGVDWLARERDFARDTSPQAILTFAGKVASSLDDTTLAVPFSQLVAQVAASSCITEMVPKVRQRVPHAVLPLNEGAEIIPFALRLAFDPSGPLSPNGQTTNLIARLVNWPGIVRVTRFLALALRKVAPNHQFS